MNIAKVVHQANKAYCEELGDFSQLNWEQTDTDIKRSATVGVAAVEANPGMSAVESHEGWMQFKLDNGWKFGEVKSEALKTHHCLVPFDELPEEHQIKDLLFVAIVNALSGVEPAVIDTAMADELASTKIELARANEALASCTGGTDKDPKSSATTTSVLNSPKKGPKIS